MQENKVSVLCLEHNQTCLFMNLSQSERKNRLLCPECLQYDKNNITWVTEFKDIVPLSIINNHPESLINILMSSQKTNLINKSVLNFCAIDLQSEFSDQLQKLKKIIYDLYETIENLANESLKSLIDYQNILRKERENFLAVQNNIIQAIKYTEYKELIQSLSSMQDDSQIQLREKISSIIYDMMKSDCKLIKKSFSEQFLTELSISQINQPIAQIQELLQVKIGPISYQFQQFLQRINFSPGSQITEIFQYLKKIEIHHPIKQINLVYSDKVNDQLFNQISHIKQALKKKNNFLIVLKTQMNQILGAYIPVIWKKKIAEYNIFRKSFLFNSDQIFPINNGNGFAVQFCIDGIKLGGNSIYISDQFEIQETSSLNYNNFDQVYKQRYIGEKIVYCEVFEITL